jgi:hypothetical protein
VPEQPSGNGTACAHPCCPLVGTTHEVPACYQGHRCRFLRMPFMADVDGDGIPLVSPRRFKTRCSLRLDAGICNRPCTAIRLLLLGARALHICHGPHHLQAALGEAAAPPL